VTQISKASERPYQIEMQPVYNRLEQRAVYLMGGWENVRGTTPDDIAQVALWSFTQLKDEYGHEGARKLASRGLQQDLRDLYQKEDREDYVADWEPGGMDDGDDLEWQWEDPSHDMVPRYFHPDTVDKLADVLSQGELEVMLAFYELDLTQDQVAVSLGKAVGTVKALKSRALKKLKEVM
jgi:DNA-directed RNA polymerase specialized sigma24 family protein